MTTNLLESAIIPFISKEIEETMLLAVAMPSEMPPRQISMMCERILARLSEPDPLSVRYAGLSAPKQK